MVEARYDGIADWYETEFLALQRWGSEDREFADTIGIDEAIVELLGPGEGPCLEVGCGTGIYAARIASLGRRPIGLDLSAGMLAHAADRLPVVRGDATALPLPDGAIDAAIGVMIHSDLPAYDRVLAEIRRVLRPGGVYLHVGVHPCFIGPFADRDDPEAAVIRPGYLDRGWTPPVGPEAGRLGRTGQVRDKVGAAHYPLADLLNLVVDAGFIVDRCAEGGAPTPITLAVRLRVPDGRPESERGAEVAAGR